MIRVNWGVPILGRPRHRDITNQSPESGWWFSKTHQYLRSRNGNDVSRNFDPRISWYSTSLNFSPLTFSHTDIRDFAESWSCLNSKVKITRAEISADVKHQSAIAPRWKVRGRKFALTSIEHLNTDLPAIRKIRQIRFYKSTTRRWTIRSPSP